jgi:lactate permease
MDWTQGYNPTGSEVLSTLLAALPILVLLGLLGLFRWTAPKAAAAGLVTALAISIWAFGMPAKMAFWAAGLGACFGLFPIGWIVFSAVFLYTLTVESGQFEKIKSSVATLSPDRRIQALLIAFCFGAFLEGCAGFGAPVAITAALMIGVGFPPLYAAGMALLANTAPVAFGSLGIPIITLGKMTNIDANVLSIMAGRQLPFFSLLIPVWMVLLMSGWRGLRQVWPAVIVAGGSFAAVQFAVSQHFGPMLVDVAGGLVSLVVMGIFLKFWQPKELWHFAGEPTTIPDPVAEATGDPDLSSRERQGASRRSPDPVAETTGDLEFVSKPSPRPVLQAYTRGDVARAWVPWLLMSVFVFIWGMPQVHVALEGKTALNIEAATIHKHIYRSEPVVTPPAKPEEAVFKFNWLTATGTAVMFASILSAIWLGVSPRRFVKTLLRTLRSLALPLFTIAAMLAIAYTTKYSGTDATLGLAFTHTGALYPFFAPLLGWLGVALTGSDTSSNALFGDLQRITAQRLGLSPVLICTSNSTGGVMGKMIDAQSIVVSASTTGQAGNESQILRFVFWHSLALACLMGLLVVLQAYVLTDMVPPLPK